MAPRKARRAARKRVVASAVGRRAKVRAPARREILEVDLLAYEKGGRRARQAVVDGVRRSLTTGFVYARHDVETSLIDEAYALLAAFFHLPVEVKRRYVVPGSMGQTGYTGLLVETAASHDTPDWKEMLNWGRELPPGHPLRRRYPHRYMERCLPEDEVPGIAKVLGLFFERMLDLQRRFLRVIAEGVGCAPTFFDALLEDGPTLARALRYPPMKAAPGQDHVWAGEHGDINLFEDARRVTPRAPSLPRADGVER